MGLRKGDIDVMSSNSKQNKDDEGKDWSKNFKIRNRQRRSETYKKFLQEKRKSKKEEKEKMKILSKSQSTAHEKKVPKTIENMRVPDITMVKHRSSTGDSASTSNDSAAQAEDEVEVMQDEACDEFAAYFNKKTTPKILVTTSDRPKKRTKLFIHQLLDCLPNANYRYRRALPLKKIVPQAIERQFTDVMVINEDQKKPNGLVFIHLPNGPTAHFRLSSVKLRKEIPHCKSPSMSSHEVILNNFNTRLGHTIGRMLASVWPQVPEFRAQQVVTFHNQRDYIFFRFHRYEFKNNKKVGLNELGPRFTLKLRSLQRGTFDSKFGEYVWFHKRHEMDTSRRKFYL